MSLVDLLAEDLVIHMETSPYSVPRNALLAIDPEAQFARLAAHVVAARQRKCSAAAPTDPGQAELSL